jgi:hypothetical protein
MYLYVILNHIREIVIHYIYVIEKLVEECYKLYIRKVTRKSIELIFIFHPHEFDIGLYINFGKLWNVTF